jgi:hypothetical protein
MAQALHNVAVFCSLVGKENHDLNNQARNVHEYRIIVVIRSQIKRIEANRSAIHNHTQGLHCLHFRAQHFFPEIKRSSPH